MKVSYKNEGALQFMYNWLQKWFCPIVLELDTYCNDLSCKEEIDSEKLLHLFDAICVSISTVVEELSESF